MSDLLSGVSSYYDTYTKNNVSADKMKDKLSSDYSSATDDEMMEVCKEFEACFTEQVFKAMEKMVPESDESSSSTSYVNMFKDTLIQEYASLSSESNGGEGLGIAQLLYEQYEKHDVNPARIMNHFTDEEEHREVDSLFHTKIKELTTAKEQEKALQETVIRIKNHSIEEATKKLDPTDIKGLQQLMNAKRELQDLQKLHISIN